MGTPVPSHHHQGSDGTTEKKKKKEEKDRDKHDKEKDKVICLGCRHGFVWVTCDFFKLTKKCCFIGPFLCPLIAQEEEHISLSGVL